MKTTATTTRELAMVIIPMSIGGENEEDERIR
jgi:hypothetical protein